MAQLKQNSREPKEGFGKLNKVLFFIGMIALVAGLLTLTGVDPEARNAAGYIAPLLIIGSFIMIFISLIIKE
jgi:hypothetical protein